MNFYLKPLALVLVLTFGYHSLFAQMTQQETFTLKQIMPTSPEAAMLGRFGDIPIGYYTGTADISIPFYTIKSGKVEIPITLSYHSSGIRVEDEASNVGLGWLLEPGGAIIQVVNGIEDNMDNLVHGSGGTTFTSDYLFLKSHVSVQGIHGARNQIGTGSFLCTGNPADGDSYQSMQELVNGYGQPDIYQYSFPGGYSGKFYISPETGLPVLIDKKQEINFHTVSGGWVATTLDGNNFYFQTQETVTLNSSKTIGYTWKLSKIVTSDGKTINFTYTTGNYTWQTSSESYHTSFPIGSAGIGGVDSPLPGSADAYPKAEGSETENTVQTITQITTDKETINFNLETRTDMPVKRIKSFDVISVASGLPIKTVNFNYDYFASSLVGGTYLDPHYNPQTTSTPLPAEITSRLKLVSVQETGYGPNQTLINNPPYQFTYNEINPLPAKTSFARDYWGYYNGANNNKLTPDLSYFYSAGELSPQFPYGTLSWVLGADRAPNKTFTTAGMLTQIKYPTGGWTQFGYEPNMFNNYNYPDGDKIALYTKNVNIMDENAAGVTNTATFTLPRTMTISFKHVFGRGYPTNPVTFNDLENATIKLNKISGGITTLLKEWTVTSDKLTEFNNPSNNGTVTIKDTYNFPYDATATYQIVDDLPDYLGPQNSATTSASVLTTFTYFAIPTTQTQASYGGGVRVASIQNYDNTGMLIGNKSIKYLNTDGSCSGLLMSPLQFAADRTTWFEDFYHTMCGSATSEDQTGYCPNKGIGSADVWWLSSESQTPLSNAAEGNIVGYSRVEETELSNNVATNGKKVYYYNNQVSETGYETPDNPYLKNGLISEDQVYDNSGNELREEDFTYGNNWDPGVASTYMAYKANYNVVLNYDCDPLYALKEPQYPAYAYLILMYPINSQWWLLSNKTTSDFMNGTPVNVTENYTYNKIGQLTTSTTTNSKSETLTTNYVFPFDIASGSTKYAMAQQLIGQNFYNNLLELHTLNGTETSQTDVSYNTINGQLVRSEIDKSYNGGTLFTDVTFDAYWPNEQVKQVTERSSQPSAFIYDQNNNYLLASIKNAAFTDVAYTSFELNQSGNWNISSNTRNTFGFSGTQSYPLSATNTVSVSGLTAGKTYVVSYWSTNNAPLSITGTLTGYPVKGVTLNGWTYYEHQITGQTSVTLSGSGNVDEVRLYPVNAQMKTFTYNPLIGITTTVDEKNQVNYYEYDGLQRLINIKDQYGNVVKHMNYHYQGN